MWPAPHAVLSPTGDSAHAWQANELQTKTKLLASENRERQTKEHLTVSERQLTAIRKTYQEMDLETKQRIRAHLVCLNCWETVPVTSLKLQEATRTCYSWGNEGHTDSECKDDGAGQG